jgi:hypothetical protein
MATYELKAYIKQQDSKKKIKLMSAKNIIINSESSHFNDILF